MACGSSGLLPHLPHIPVETVTPQAHAHLFLSTAGLLGEWQVTAAGSHVADEPRNMFTVLVGRRWGQGLRENPQAIEMVLGDQDFAPPKTAPEVGGGFGKGSELGERWARLTVW